MLQRWFDLIYPGELFTAKPEYREEWKAIQRRLFFRDLFILGVGMTTFALIQLAFWA